jgi:Ca2+-binding EF-hand superfamily protein
LYEFIQARSDSGGFPEARNIFPWFQIANMSASNSIDTKCQNEIKYALNRDKKQRYNLEKRTKLIQTLKQLDSNVALTDFILILLLGMDPSDVVDYFKDDNYLKLTPEWKEGQKTRIADAVKRSGLEGQKLISAVRAILSSSNKPEIMQVAQISLVSMLDNGEKQLSTESEKAERERKGAKLKFEDRMALYASIADHPALNKMQKRAVKVAVSESKGSAKDMVDLVDILISVLKKQSPEEIENVLKFVSTDATFDTRKAETIKVLNRSTDMFKSEDARQAVIETVGGPSCITPANFVAILQTGLAQKERVDIEEAPGKISDAEKIALVGAFSRSEISKEFPKMAEAAKHAVMKADTHAEQVIVCQLFLAGVDDLTMRKGAKIAAVNGTRKLVAVTDKQRTEVIKTLQECDFLPEDYPSMYFHGIKYVQNQQMMVQMLMTAVVKAPKVLIEKLLRSWETKASATTIAVKVESKKKTVTTVLLEACSEEEKKAAIAAVNECPTVSKSDINAAIWAITEAATQIHLVMILTAIIEGRSARNIKRALTETHLHPVTDIPSPDLIADINNSISHSKVAPGKQQAAIKCIKESKRMSRIAAVLAMVIANKSPPKILNSTRLADEFKVMVDDSLVSSKKSNKEAKKAFKTRFASLLKSTIYDHNQKIAAIRSLQRPLTAPVKVEVFLRILERQPAENILAGADAQGLARVLSLKEKTQICQRIEGVILHPRNKSKLLASVKKAPEKKDVANMLEQVAVLMLEEILPEELDELEVAINDSQLLIDEKRTYISGWMKKVDTRDKYFRLVAATHRWQSQPLHWVGIAYEEIFQGPTLYPMSPECLAEAKTAVKESKVSDELKQAAADALSRCSTVVELISVMIALLKEKKGKEIKKCAQSTKIVEIPDLMEEFFSNEVDESDDRKRKKKKKRDKSPAAKKSSKKEKEKELHIQKMALEKQIKFDTSIVAVLRNSLISALHTNVSKEKDLELFQRIVGLLSQSTRYNDKEAKTDEASRKYIEMCHAIIVAYGDFDDNEQEKVMNEVEDAKYIYAVTMKLRDLVGKKAIQDGFVDDEEFETFAFSPNKDLARPMDVEDTHLVIDHIDRHPFGSGAQKTASKKVILGSCSTRKQVLQVLKMLDDGGTPRQIAALAPKLEREKSTEQSIEISEEIKKKQAERNAAFRLKQELAQRIEGMAKEVANLIQKLSGPKALDLTDYQRTASMRMAIGLRSFESLAALMEGLLANLSGSQLRSVEKSEHGTLNTKRLVSIMDVCKLTPEARAAAVKALTSGGLRDDEHRALVILEAMRTACAELDAEAELEAERKADLEASGKDKAEVPEGGISANDRLDMVSKVSQALIHHPQRRLLALKCTTHISSYFNLTGVLFGIVMEAQDGAIEQATKKSKIVVKIPKETANEMVHRLKTSHMLAMFHGHQANDLMKAIENSSSYEAVAKALLQTIVEYGKCLDTHAPSPPTKQPRGKGGASYRRYKKEEETVDHVAKEIERLKLEPARKIIPLQKKRILEGLKKFKYLTRGAKFTAMHFIEEHAKLVVEVNKIIQLAFLPNLELLTQKKKAQNKKAEYKAERRAALEAAKEKALAERQAKKKARKEAKEKDKQERRAKRQALKDQIQAERNESAALRFYEVVFVEGSMGLGLDPVHNAAVGSVVTVIGEDSQAEKCGKIRPGDQVISIGGIAISNSSHEKNMEVVKNASRPCTIVFERALYHVHPDNAEDENDIRKIYENILDEENTDGVQTEDLKAALKKINIVLGDEELGLLLGDVQELIDEDSFEFEEFLHHAFDLTEHAEKVAEAHDESEDEEREYDTEEEEEKMQEEKVRKLWAIVDADGSMSVDAEELRKGFKEIGIHMDDNHVDEMLGHLDEDKSGHITFDEFLAYITGAIMMPAHDYDGYSSESEVEVEGESDVANDPAVVIIKKCFNEGNHFGLGDNPHDFVDDDGRKKVEAVLSAVDVEDLQALVIKSRHVTNAQEVLNLYESLLYCENPEQMDRFVNLKTYTPGSKGKVTSIVPTVPSTFPGEFVSDESDGESELNDFVSSMKEKPTYTRKLPHNLTVKHQKNKTSLRRRLPKKKFKIEIF